MTYPIPSNRFRAVKFIPFKLIVDSRWRNALLLFTTSFLLILHLAWQHPMLIVIGLVGVAIALMVRDLGRILLTTRRWRWLIQTVFVGYGICLVWFQFQPAANAVFFSTACQWMQSTFGTALTNGGGATTPTTGTIGAIPLIFDALRAVLLLYAGISLVSIVQALRQDEEWLTVARTPLAVLVCVVLADILTTLIVPAAANAAGTQGC